MPLPGFADYWGLEGFRCDNWPSLWRSALCHRRLPFGVPPTLLGLFFMRSQWGTTGQNGLSHSPKTSMRDPMAPS